LLLSAIVCVFRRSFYTLRKFICSVGNTQLSNKMESYTTDQKMFIKTFYSFGCSCGVVKRQYRRELSVCATWEAITSRPRRSVRRLAQQIGISTSTSWKICRDDLSLFPYKMQLSQPLSEDGIARRNAFAWEYGVLLEDKPRIFNATWFSDQAHFHLDGYINK
jgi:hypothetical protein